MDKTEDSGSSWVYPVVKLLSKRWWIRICATPEGPKLDPEGPRGEVGFATADQWFSSIQGTLGHSGFYGIQVVFDAWILPSRVVDPGKKVPDLNSEVQDLLLEVVDFE